MKQAFILAICLSSVLLLLTSVTHSQPSKLPLRIQLAPFSKGQELWTTMTFRNQSRQPIYLNKIDIGQSPRLLNNLFVIESKGQPVAYEGVLAKRRSPTTDDFVLLKPGQSVQTTIRLDQSYAFLPGKHQYTIQYKHYHGSPVDESLLKEYSSAQHSFVYTSR